MYAAGTVLAGKYRVEHVLGQGGMGVVVAATHTLLGTRVALKLLHEEMARRQKVVDRFLREARASARLTSEHICRVSDVGLLDSGVPYLVMELLEGIDLASLLRAHGPQPPATIADLVGQACAGLAEAHAADIVHRDLKPGNIFLTRRPDGRPLVKVLDFGVAKAPSEVDFDLTQTATIIGSPGYMSPEQLRSSRQADARSDVWSLGVVMYQLATGQKPFAGESITDLAVRVAMDPTPPLPSSVDPTFAAIVYRCLEKDPARRYQDVASLAAALAPHAGLAATPGALPGLLPSPLPGPLPSAMAGPLAGPLPGPLAGPLPSSMAGPLPSSMAGPLAGPPASTPTTLGGSSGELEARAPRGRGRLVAAIGAAVGVSAAVALLALGGGRDGGAPRPVTSRPAPAATGGDDATGGPEGPRAPATAPLPASASGTTTGSTTASAPATAATDAGAAPPSAPGPAGVTAPTTATTTTTTTAVTTPGPAPTDARPDRAGATTGAPAPPGERGPATAGAPAGPAAATGRGTRRDPRAQQLEELGESRK